MYNNVLLNVDVTGAVSNPSYYQVNFPSEIAGQEPVIFAKEIKENYWAMNCVEISSEDGFLIRYIDYDIEKDQVLNYNLNRAAICLRIQFKGENAFQITSKRTICLPEGQYNVVAFKPNGVKLAFQKGKYQVVEVYVASSSMDVLKPYFSNFGAIDRKQKVSKMSGESAYYGKLNKDICQIVDTLWENYQGLHIEPPLSIKDAVLQLFALATRSQEQPYYEKNKNVSFHYNTKWRDVIIRKGIDIVVNDILSSVLPNSEFTIAVKGNVGWMLMQLSRSTQAPIWNFIYCLVNPCSVYIYPNSRHYSFIHIEKNSLVLESSLSSPIQMSEGTSRVVDIFPSSNIYHLQPGISRIIQVYFERPPYYSLTPNSVESKIMNLEGKVAKYGEFIKDIGFLYEKQSVHK